MKMIQTMYPSVQPWVEVFYDGQARVENNIIEVPKRKSHWRDALIVRGFSDLEEPQVEGESPPTVEASEEVKEKQPTPKKQTRSRKKVSNANSEE